MSPSSRAGDAPFAANWRTVLAVDALIGVAALVAGAVLVWQGALGGVLLAVAGAAYTTLVARRARTWARLRRERAEEKSDGDGDVS
jgi:hypothetical protein